MINSIPLEKANKQGIIFFEDRILAALLSFIIHNEAFFKRLGMMRQKVINMAEAVFPDIPLELVIDSLQILGLFFSRGESLIPDYQRLAAFGKLSRQERLEYCTAGILCYYGEPLNEISPWQFRVKVRNYAVIVRYFYASLNSDYSYPLTTLRRMVHILKYNNPEISCEKLVAAMEQTGLLVSDSKNQWKKITINPAPNSSLATGPVIAMDSPFTLLLYPEIAYNDALELAAVSRVTEAGINVRFELTKDSIISAFNRGITAESIIKLVKRLSQNRIDDNLIFTLLDWEKRHQEVTLRKGLILNLSPEHRYLAETKAMSKLIIETLAPGVYLLPEINEEKVFNVLRRAGITIFSSSTNQQAKAPEKIPTAFLPNDASAGPNIFFPHLNEASDNYFFDFGNHDIGFPQPNEEAALALMETFHSAVDKMRIGGEQREELAARINRRLVLCESQLKGTVIRYEKLEARGLDYAGKIHIVKQAMAMQSQVEVNWPGRERQERVFGIPITLEKIGGEYILTIEPANKEIIRIPLGKISLLRRIKKSIFENNIN
jgi:hypothetical protein